MPLGRLAVSNKYTTTYLIPFSGRSQGDDAKATMRNHFIVLLCDVSTVPLKNTRLAHACSKV